MKNKGRFWRAKASLFGRESVAAFLVGDLGCAYRDQTAPIFDWMQPAPPSTPFRFETGPWWWLSVRFVQLCRFHASCPKLSAGTPKSLLVRYSLLVIRHSSLVTSPGNCHDWQPPEAFPCSLFPKPIHPFLSYWCGPCRADGGTCRRGANLNNCGQRRRRHA